MELLLWRWSTAAQVTSAVMIAVFFAALTRSYPRAEVRWWLRAWLANVIALGVTLVFWYFDPPPSTLALIRALYVSAKTIFLLLLLQGAWAHLRPGAILFSTPRMVIVATVGAILGAFVLTSVNLVGFVQHLVIALVLGAGGFALARSGDRGLTWLAAGLGIRSLLGLVEAAAYASQITPLVAGELGGMTSTFLSAHSSLDTAAEWLIALGCVLAVADRNQSELRATNESLLEAHTNLSRLVDRDPLTGLANRRSLPELLRAVQPKGAMLLFLDIDGFKAINDLHGHRGGDECLKQFATALRECFRPDDAVVRFGGDEFLIVAAGLDRAAVDERVEQVRWRLRKATSNPPAVDFSVGIAELTPGGSPEAALQAADEAMYRAKDTARGTPASA